VIGGTINHAASFLMRAEKVGQHTLLSRIVHMVQDAQRSKAPIQDLVDTVSGYFVPVVICIALLTFFIWCWFGPAPSVPLALMNAVSVLIIACPCALGLATPLSIMVGMGKGAEVGVLFKHAQAIQKLESIRTLVLDKTGTVTEGKPQVVSIHVQEGFLVDELLRIVASVEGRSEHPLAQAIIEETKKRDLAPLEVSDFHVYPSKGIEGRVRMQHVFVGKASFLKEQKIVGIDEFMQRMQSDMHEDTSAIFVAIQNKIAGCVVVSHPIKKSAPSAIEKIQELGVRVILVSGDLEKTVRYIAQKLHVDGYHAQVDPLFKEKFVRSMKCVAMAGDGINDAPALAAADVGIAMGTGTDIAIESADVTLVRGDILGIVRAMKLSRTIMKNIRQNLFFAFFYNAAFIPIGAGVLFPWFGLLMSPVYASIAMSLSSLSVVINSLRLRYVKL
jgi:Cu+-exporting ATPase